MGKDSNWGYMPYLTEDQKKMLKELRERVDRELPKKEYLAKDTTLLRFCRARNFHPHKTFTMIKEDLEWRSNFEGYVFIRSRDFGGAYALHEAGAIRLGGKAKDGRPVLMVKAREYWPRLITDLIQISYFFAFYVDAVCRMAESVGHETFYALADLEGFTMANFSFNQLKLAISILQNFYPERLGMIYVINAPWAFTAAWRMIQPLLDERTRNKIDILGADYTKKVLENIDPSQMEKAYGGTHDPFPIPDEIVQIAIDNEKYLKTDGAEAIPVAAPSTPTTTATPVVGATLTAAAASASQSKTSGTAPALDSSSPTSAPPPSGVSSKTLLTSSPSSRKAAAATSSTATSRIGVRRNVRRILKRVLFTTDRRAEANSVGRDPDAVDDPLEAAVVGSSSSTSVGGGKALSTKKKNSSSSGLGMGGEEEEEEEGTTLDDETGDLEKELAEVREAGERTVGMLVKHEQHVNLTLNRFQMQLHALLVAILALTAWIVTGAMGARVHHQL